MNNESGMSASEVIPRRIMAEWSIDATRAELVDALLTCNDEVAALQEEIRSTRAELNQTTDERNALLHSREVLRAKLEGYRNGNHDLHVENQALRAEVERLNAEVGCTNRAAEKAEAEVERMRPVVEAACDLAGSQRTANDTTCDGLIAAVDEYREASRGE